MFTMAHALTQQIKNILGENIRKQREKRNLKQSDVASETGIHPSYYPRIERGGANLTLGSLYRIVKALKIKSSDILPF